MHDVGLEAISFYSSHYYIELAKLAEIRQVNPERFTKSIGQEKMAVPPPGEDIVTLAANAAEQALDGIDTSKIDMLIFATESGIDQSKAAGIFVHSLLGLNSRCRVFEVKQACFGATAGIQHAISHIKLHPKSKVLIIASDIARYGLNTPGEATQGGGAVAMVLSTECKLLKFEGISGIYTEDVMDFWRPNYRDEALVDGKASVRVYVNALIESWKHFQEQCDLDFTDFYRFCYHLPFTRMSETAHKRLIKAIGAEVDEELFQQQINDTLHYNRLTGNSYSASLYLGLTSLLDHDDHLANKRIALFSYGSGCMAEFFSAVVSEEYLDYRHKDLHQLLITDRKEIDYALYEEYYNFASPKDGSSFTYPELETGSFRLSGLESHKRIYQKLN